MLRFYVTLERFSSLCFIRILNHILDEETYFHGISWIVYPSVPYGLLHDHSHYKNTWMLRVKILCGSWEFREKETKAHIDHRNAWEPHAWIACWRRVVLCPHLVFSFMSKTFVSSKRWLQFKLVVTFVTSKSISFMKFQSRSTHHFSCTSVADSFLQNMIPKNHSFLQNWLCFFTCIALMWLPSPSLTWDIESQTSQ